MGVITQPEHPGRMCGDVHPGIPHRQIAPEPHAGLITGSQPMIEATLQEVDQDWQRFDEWSSRMLDYAAQAIEAAKAADTKAADAIGDHYPALPQTLEQIARMCTDLACAASPNGALPPLTAPTITLGR